MNSGKPIRSALVALSFCTLVTACASAPQAPPSWNGLELQPSDLFTAVYVQPDAEFKRFDTVLIDPVEVEFDENWNSEAARKDLAQLFTPEALDAIEDEMAAEFRRIFAAELGRGGYQLVGAPAADTVRLSPSLVDIYINAPVDISRGSPGTYMVEAARMTLVMELRDGTTDRLLARVVDQQAGARTAFPEVTESVARSPEFRRAVAGWAIQLRQGLDALEVRP